MPAEDGGSTKHKDGRYAIHTVAELSGNHQSGSLTLSSVY